MRLALFKKKPKPDKKDTPAQYHQNPGGSFARFFKNPYVVTGLVLFALVGTVTLLISNAASYTANSAKTGNWSDPNTWQDKRVPKSNAKVVIRPGHTVTFDWDTQVSGVEVGEKAALRFSPGKSAQLSTNRNIVIKGTLTMIPSSNAQQHSIVFIGVNNTKFKGSGMDPIESDVGLWVIGKGQLNIHGSSKTSWTNLRGKLRKGQKSGVRLASKPSNWLPGDEIFVTPTQPPSEQIGNASWEGFDDNVLTQVGNSQIVLASPAQYEHPRVNGRWTAEVGNLTRNVKISGTENGFSHVFIRSTRPQTIRYAELTYMGVPSKSGKDEVLGRYGLHFHHSLDGSRGSLVEGVVVHKAANHAFVPHASHGVTFKDTIAYDTVSDAYWWDQNIDAKSDPKHAEVNDSNNIVIDHAIAARVRDNGEIRLAGFRLSEGKDDSNILRNSVAVGIAGRSQAAGFTWKQGTNTWKFNKNLAHNNKINGLFVWQNDTREHLMTNFTAYYNRNGIWHGAYKNRYKFQNMNLYGNKETGILLNASSDKGLVKFTGVKIDGAGITTIGINSCCQKQTGNKYPTIFENGFIRGVKYGVYIDKGGDKNPDPWIQVKNILVDAPIPYYLKDTVDPTASLEVQNSTQHFCVTTKKQNNRSVKINTWNGWQTLLFGNHSEGTGSSTGC